MKQIYDPEEKVYQDKMSMRIDVSTIDMFIDTRDRTVFSDLRGDE